MADRDRLDNPAPADGDKDISNEDIDQEIREDLEERQQLDQGGREVLRRRLREHTFMSPKLTGGDIDANWELGNTSEEVIAGQVPTPDQGVVDEIGEGAGLTYEDNEPLNYGKVSARDKKRWELNPVSVLDADKDEPEGEDEDLEELGLLDEEAESIEIIDVDDLLEEEEEDEETEDVEEEDVEDLEDLDEVELDDLEVDDEEEEEEDEEEDEDDEDDDEEEL